MQVRVQDRAGYRASGVFSSRCALTAAARGAAMNALFDPKLKAAFASEFPLAPLDNMLASAQGGNRQLSGKALLENVYARLTRGDQDIRFPDTVGGCFTKGTRVHTREGRKPIEDIKVGDWVLSSPENGRGEAEYKQVVNTFVFHDKTIVELRFRLLDKTKQGVLLSVTGNHPFWLEKRRGWTRADHLKEGDCVRMSDGRSAKVVSQFPVYAAEKSVYHPIMKPGVGWVQRLEYSLVEPFMVGYLWNYAENCPVPEGEEERDYFMPDMVEENRLKTTVYNIEVEDFHTYYVSAGFWVHNTNCVDSDVVPFKRDGRQANTDMASINGVERYKSLSELNHKLGVRGGQTVSPPQGFAVVPSPEAGMRFSGKEVREKLAQKLKENAELTDADIAKLSDSDLRAEVAQSPVEKAGMAAACPTPRTCAMRRK